MTRQGITFAEVAGTVTGALPVPDPYETRQFWFKFMPAVSGQGFDGDVLLVRVDQVRTPVTVEAVDAKVVLRDLASAPLADLPVEELRRGHVDDPTGHHRPPCGRPRRPCRVRALRRRPLRLTGSVGTRWVLTARSRERRRPRPLPVRGL